MLACLLPNLLLLLACGGGQGADSGLDGGAADGGAADGGAADGGAADGGADGGGQDADGDGWAAGEDCDDGDDAVHPGADEVCGDGVDEDCDGVAAPCAPLGAVNPRDHLRLLAPEPGGYGGHAVVAVPDIDGDGVGELWVSANRAGSTATQGGAAYLVLGPISASGLLEDAALVVRGGETWWLGTSLGAAGDVDGDGVADLLAGAPDDHVLEPEAARGAGPGRAVVISGASRGVLGPGEAHATLEGEADGDKAGSSVDGGDLDGDGISEVVVGAYLGDRGADAGGAAYVLEGPVEGDGALADAALVLYGTQAGEQVGGSVQVLADQDGDGLGELLISGDGDERDVPGRVYLVDGALRGAHAIGEVYTALVQSTEPNDNMGSTAIGGADLDGDAVGDLLLCAYDAQRGGFPVGVAYVLRGPFAGVTVAQDTARTTIWGDEDSYHAAEACGLAGDVDRDGRVDVLIGAHDHGVDGEGRAYLYYDLPEGEVRTADADAVFLGGLPDEDMGWSVGGGVDLTGDGLDDLVIGDRLLAEDQDLQGAAFVVPGGVR